MIKGIGQPARPPPPPPPPPKPKAKPKPPPPKGHIDTFSPAKGAKPAPGHASKPSAIARPAAHASGSLFGALGNAIGHAVASVRNAGGNLAKRAVGLATGAAKSSKQPAAPGPTLAPLLGHFAQRLSGAIGGVKSAATRIVGGARSAATKIVGGARSATVSLATAVKSAAGAARARIVGTGTALQARIATAQRQMTGATNAFSHSAVGNNAVGHFVAWEANAYSAQTAGMLKFEAGFLNGSSEKVVANAVAHPLDTVKAAGTYIQSSANGLQHQISMLSHSFEQSRVGNNVTGHFLAGAVDGVSSAVTGTVGLAGGLMNGTVEHGVANAVQHPMATLHALKNAVVESWQKDPAHFLGEAAGQVAVAVATAGAGSALAGARGAGVAADVALQASDVGVASGARAVVATADTAATGGEAAAATAARAQGEALQGAASAAARAQETAGLVRPRALGPMDTHAGPLEPSGLGDTLPRPGRVNPQVGPGAAHQALREGQSVSVLRTAGQTEHGWTIAALKADGRAMVVNPAKTALKEVQTRDLLQWNGATRQALDFQSTSRIGAGQAVRDGYFDGGRGMAVRPDGSVQASREVLVVDRARDAALQRDLAFARSIRDLPEAARARALAQHVHQYINPPGGGGEAAWLPARAGKEVLLGDVRALGGGSCRHAALMYKVLGDEANLQVSLVRGSLNYMGRSLAHAWNEVRLGSGGHVIDVLQSAPNFTPIPADNAAALYHAGE